MKKVGRFSLFELQGDSSVIEWWLCIWYGMGNASSLYIFESL